MTTDEFASALRCLAFEAQVDGLDLVTVLALLEDQAEAMRYCDD